MSRHQESAPYYLHPLDSKARRKLQDQRRMHFRRAIEQYDEQRRLHGEIDDYPDHILASSLQFSRESSPRSDRRAR